MSPSLGGPPRFPPSSTWRVPAQQPGDQQGASQAQAVAGTGSFLLSSFPLSGCLTASSLGQRPAPLRVHPGPHTLIRRQQRSLTTTPGRVPDPASCRDLSPATTCPASQRLPETNKPSSPTATKALCKHHGLHTLLSHKHGSKALFVRRDPGSASSRAGSPSLRGLTQSAFLTTVPSGI